MLGANEWPSMLGVDRGTMIEEVDFKGESTTVGRTPTRAGVEVDLLYSEGLLVAVPPNHRLAGGVEVGPSGQGDFADPTPTVARSLVLAGEGIAVLGESERDFWQPAVVLPMAEPAPTHSIALVYRSGRVSSATGVALGFLRTTFGFS